MQIDAGDQLLARARGLEPIAEIAPFVGASDADVYLVGGSLRDLILGRDLVDVDLAVDGEPSELARAIGTAAGIETRFGTLSVQRAGYRYDLARTRSERYAQPGALPDTEAAGIDADLRRRDFSVNAIALGLAGSRVGELLTVPGALEDLERGRLAVLHDQSFLDDPTRLLRLARYAARLGFTPVPQTRQLATEAIADNALDTVSGTRIGNELRLLATEPDPIAAFQAVQEIGLPWAIDAPLARGAIEALPQDGRADLVVLSLALTAVDGDGLDAMGFTASERTAILEGRAASALARGLAGAGSNSEIVRTVGTSGIETVALASSQGARSQSLTWLQDLRHLQLEINGDDLIENGIPEGRQIGQALQAAKDALLDGTAMDRESQLRVALDAAE